MSPCFTFKYFAANLEFLKLLLTKALKLAKFTRAGLNLTSKFKSAQISTQTNLKI